MTAETGFSHVDAREVIAHANSRQHQLKNTQVMADGQVESPPEAAQADSLRQSDAGVAEDAPAPVTDAVAEQNTHSRDDAAPKSAASQFNVVEDGAAVETTLQDITTQEKTGSQPAAQHDAAQDKPVIQDNAVRDEAAPQTIALETLEQSIAAQETAVEALAAQAIAAQPAVAQGNFVTDDMELDQTQLSAMSVEDIAEAASGALETMGSYENTHMIADEDMFYGSTEDNSVVPQDIAAFAKLQFDDGEFYITTYQIELGRPADASRPMTPQVATFWQVPPPLGAQINGIAPKDSANTSPAQHRPADRGDSDSSSIHSASPRKSARDSLVASQSHVDPTECPHVPIFDPINHDDEGKARVISRRHVRIAYQFDEGYFEMEVLGRNGAFHCEQWIPQNERKRLRDGNTIQLGGVRMTFRLPTNQRPEDDTDTRTEATSHHMSMDFENGSGDALEVTDYSSSDDNVRHRIRPRGAHGHGDDSDEDDSSSSSEDQAANKHRPRHRDKVNGKPTKGSKKDTQAHDDNRKKKFDTKKSAKARHNGVSTSGKVRAGESAPAKQNRKPQNDDAKRAETKTNGEARVESDSGDESPVMVDLGQWGEHPAPPRKRGPGRPPKGAVSKRVKNQMIKDLKERLGQPPNQPLNGVLGTPKISRPYSKPPERPAVDQPREETSNRDKVDQRAPPGSNDAPTNQPGDQPAIPIGAESPERPSTPRPQRSRSDFTAEQLEKPPTCYAQTLWDILIDIPEGLTLQNVYQKIKDKWPYYEFELNSKGWESSVRHNLNQNSSFFKDVSNPKRPVWKVDSKNPPFRPNRNRQPATPTGNGPSTALEEQLRKWQLQQATFYHSKKGFVPPNTEYYWPVRIHRMGAQYAATHMNGSVQHPQWTLPANRFTRPKSLRELPDRGAPKEVVDQPPPKVSSQPASAKDPSESVLAEKQPESVAEKAKDTESMEKPPGSDSTEKPPEPVPTQEPLDPAAPTESSEPASPKETSNPAPQAQPQPASSAPSTQLTYQSPYKEAESAIPLIWDVLPPPPPPPMPRNDTAISNNYNNHQNHKTGSTHSGAGLTDNNRPAHQSPTPQQRSDTSALAKTIALLGGYRSHHQQPQQPLQQQERQQQQQQEQHPRFHTHNHHIKSTTPPGSPSPYTSAAGDQPWSPKRPPIEPLTPPPHDEDCDRPAPENGAVINDVQHGASNSDGEAQRSGAPAPAVDRDAKEPTVNADVVEDSDAKVLPGAAVAAADDNTAAAAAASQPTSMDITMEDAK